MSSSVAKPEASSAKAAPLTESQIGNTGGPDEDVPF